MAAAICAIGSAGWASAQVQPASDATQPEVIETVIITGSRIRRIDAESALPVQVITAADIDKSGKTSITEVLSSLAINGANGVTDTGSFSNFAYGASGISLRGLGPTATLILINGRRVAPYSVPDIGKGLTNFVNVDAIPRAAIERIEILKDGASAIYGSDAMAGVVNIILRSDYEGAQVDGSASANQQGNFGTKWASLTLGKGKLDRDGWNWMANLETYHRAEVMLRDVKDEVIDPRNRDSSFYYTGRPYTNRYSPYPNYYPDFGFDPANGTSGVYVPTGQASANCPAGNSWAFNSVNNANLCGYDFWNQAAQYRSPLDRQALFTRGEVQTGGVTLFGEFAYTRLTNKQRNWPVPFGSGLGATPNGRDGGVSYLPQYLPEGHPNNPFPNQPAGITYLFQDVGMQGTDVTNNTSRLLLGARGAWNSFDWEVGLLSARDQVDVSYINRISLPVLRDAILNGTYNFENPSAGAITAKDLRVNPQDNGVSQFTALDAKLSGTLAQLPAGPLGFAAGAEFRHEMRNYRPDERIYSGQVYLQVAGQTQGSRNVATAFTELNVPVARNLESQLALRADHYSDYGSSVTPKVALAWKAQDNLKLRSSFSSGFRAPSLNESANSDTPLFNYVGFDPKRCGDFNVDCDGYNNSGVTKANKELKPETSQSLSAGFVFQPLRNLSMAIDYWQFDRKNEISSLDQQEVIDHEDSTDPLFVGRVHRMPDDTVSVPGQVIPGRITTVEKQFVNRGRSQVRGVDLDIQLGFRPEGWGVVKTRTVFTYLDRSRFRSQESDAWTTDTGTLGVPRVRGSFSVDWSLNAMNVGMTTNYLSGYLTTLPDDDCSGARFLGACSVPGYTTFDIYGSYELSKNFTVRGTVRNVTNERMPFVPTAPTGNQYWYSPEGRYFTASATYKF